MNSIAQYARRDASAGGQHLAQSCVDTAMACMMAFAAITQSLHDQEWEVQWTSLTTLCVSRKREAELWRLQHEDDFRKS